MKLSKAIREGKKGTEKITGELFKFKNDECVGSCALGSAYIGVIGVPERSNYDFKAEEFWASLREEFPILNKHVDDLPTELTKDIPRYALDANLLELTWNLNDIEKWSREEIADWFEKLESKLDES